MILRLNSQNPPAHPPLPPCPGAGACRLPDSFVILLQGVCRGRAILHNSGKLLSEGAALRGTRGLGRARGRPCRRGKEPRVATDSVRIRGLAATGSPACTGVLGH